jgi:4-amino-4-deoxy-L-arabinose transferase-like glycosyltransferase
MKKLSLYQIWFLFSVLSLSILGIIALQRPFHGDERHIVETIRLFANSFSFDTIKNYPEVTPPFFFIFYALWAKLFGQSIESLRVLTLIISFITWQLLYWLNSYFTKNAKHSFLLSFLVVINPYFFGTSVYVFTDMLTIMLLLTGIIVFLKNQILLFTILSTLAILSRQYVIIFPISIIIYSFLTYKKNNQNSIKLFIASIISFIPIFIFILIWKNVSPQSGIDKWIIPNSSFYNVDYITSYITFSIIYSLPIIILYFFKIKLNYRTVIITLMFTVALSFFPIKPSLATLVQTNYTTVGYAHKLFVRILGDRSLSLKIFLGLLLFAGTYLSIDILKFALKNLKDVLEDKKIVPILLWILFLLIMPLSYQVWEKYLTMVLPFFILSIYFLINRSTIENKV